MPTNPQPNAMIGVATRTEVLHEPELPRRVRVVIELRGGIPRGSVQVSEIDGTIVLEGELTRYYARWP